MTRSGITVIFCLIVFVNCSNSSLRIESIPDSADITAFKEDKTPIRIGKTPITIESGQVTELYREALNIVAEKKGYQSYGVLVPKSMFKTQSKLIFNMKPSSENSANDLAFGIAKAQNLIMKRNLDEAETLLVQLSSKYTDISIIYDLLGNTYYLKKNVKQALNAYKKSDELKPNNHETLQMIQKLSEMNMKGD